MRLYVYVLEARGLPHPQKEHGGGGGFYARVKVGKQRARTRAVGAGAGGAAGWNEEFVFAVGAEDVAVEVGVARRREGAAGREVVGRVKLPVPAPVEPAGEASGSGRRSLPPTWFTLQPKHRRKDSATVATDCGA